MISKPFSPMKKNAIALVTLISIGLFNQLNAQNVGINGTGAAPDASALLDVVAADKGLLIPRVSITDALTAAPVTGPATSLLVYNTNAAITNGDGLGYYFWDGAKWVKLLDANATGDAWQLLGNTGTNPTTNFVGTIDAQDLVFRTNSIENMRINTSGNVDIGAGFDDARIYARVLNTDVTTNYGAYIYHDGGITSGNTYGTRTINYSSTNSTKYGIYNYTNNEGTGARYGFYNYTYLNSGSTSAAYGIRNYTSTYGTSTHYGIYNYITSASATGTHYGQRNYVYLATGNTNANYGEYTYMDYSSGERYGEYKQINSNATYDGDIYGDYNQLYGSGDGLAYGDYNSIEVTGTGAKYAGYNSITGTGSGLKYGAYNNMMPTGAGTQYAVYNLLEATNTSAKYGIYNRWANVAGTKYGVYNYIPSGTVTGTIYGLYNSIQADGNSTKYGAYTSINGGIGALRGYYSTVTPATTNTSTIYGVYSYVSANGTGTHYGLYSNTPGATTDYAAMLYAGNVVANEIGGNYDFRIEGDTETNLVFVDASGDKVGIGLATPTYRLDVRDPSTANPTYVLRVRNGTAVGTRTQIGSVEYFLDQSSTIDFTGGSNFGINMNAAAAYDLQLSINSAAKPGSNAWTVASDRRLKEDINPFKDGLATLRGIEPVYFKYNGEANIQEEHYFVGVIAQELEKVAPYMVGSYESAPGDIPFEQQEAATKTYKSVDNGAMTYIAINAIKELDEKQTITQKAVKNISDFGMGKVSGTETFIPFSTEFKSMLTGIPMVTVTPVNATAALTIVSQSTDGFTVKVIGEGTVTNFNWIAMAKINQEILTAPTNGYSEEERQQMIAKIKAERAKIDYQREYDEIAKRAKEEAEEDKVREVQAKQGEIAAKAANPDADVTKDAAEAEKDRVKADTDIKASQKAAMKSKQETPKEEVEAEVNPDDEKSE